MTVPLRTLDELQAAPALATLPALSACIDSFVAALDVTHPNLFSSHCPAQGRETAALLLHMHLDLCQHLLREYDDLTFDATYWSGAGGPDEDDHDDIPF